MSIGSFLRVLTEDLYFKSRAYEENQVSIVPTFLTSLSFFHDCSVRSPVFSAMLESNLAEAQSGTLIIKDMSSKGMKELLRYLYTGSLKTTPDSILEIDLVAELLNASEKVRLKLSAIQSSLVFNNSHHVQDRITL
jgi:hypothetical protein